MLKKFLPYFLGGVDYKQIQVQVGTKSEEYFTGNYGTKTEQYIIGYNTKQETYQDGYGTKTETYNTGRYNTKTEQYITGYQKKTVTELQGEDPYQFNNYTNNKVGKTTNRYATADDLHNQNATGSTCYLMNQDYVDINTSFISLHGRCLESSASANIIINVAGSSNNIIKTTTNRLVNGLSPFTSNDITSFRINGSGGFRSIQKVGAYNPNSSQTTVTKQVDDTSRPIYGTRIVTDYNSPIYATRTVTDYNNPIYRTRTVTDYNSPIYGTRTVTDTSKPIYATRQVPVYEWKWVEE